MSTAVEQAGQRFGLAADGRYGLVEEFGIDEDLPLFSLPEMTLPLSESLMAERPSLFVCTCFFGAFLHPFDEIALV